MAETTVADPPPLLAVRALHKHFGASGGKVLRAVDGVDLVLRSGETLGLVGESGSGKSTLGRCILRLTQPTSGHIVFEGTDITRLGGQKLRALRKHMQVVFQDPFGSLDPRFRIGQTIEEPLRVHAIVDRRDRAKEIDRLLATVNLSLDSANRYPHEFSGGQRQRVGIARAMAVRPKLLIADEPVSALDVSIRAQVLNLLRTAGRESNLGMLFIGHDLGVIRQISKRVAVMYLGRIVEEAQTDQLYDNPRHPYTRLLLDAIPAIDHAGHRSATRSVGQGDAMSPADLPTGCRFRNRCGFAQPKCTAEEPSLKPLSSDAGHRCACHFAETIPPFERK